MISGPRKPFVELTIAGAPSGFYLDGSLKEFTYTDYHHAKVDEIAFKLADGNGLWRSAWAVDIGTEVSGLIGYLGLGGQIDCGLYAVDEDEAAGDGSGDTMTFRALSAFTSNELRTERSEAHDQRKLKAIVDIVAARHGFEVIGDIPDLTFDRITQKKESDLAFLTRLANDYGCYFSVKGKYLVFTDRKGIEDADPVRTFDLSEGQPITRYRLRKSSHKLYKKAQAKYLNPKSKQLISVEWDDQRVTSGDTLKIDDRAETRAHAERLCYARLARENDDLGTGSIKLVGDPYLVAGQVIMLGATYGKYAGRWLVTKATHRFSSSGYTTSITIKVL